MAKGGKRVGAGRPKGSRAIAKAAASTVAAVSNGKAPAKIKAGIDPKDLLVSAMRTAWDLTHSLAADALKAHKKALKLAEGTAERDIADQLAKELRVAAKHALEDAKSAAISVAPYLHPKLANVEQNSQIALTVEILKF